MYSLIEFHSPNLSSASGQPCLRCEILLLPLNNGAQLLEDPPAVDTTHWWNATWWKEIVCHCERQSSEPHVNVKIVFPGIGTIHDLLISVMGILTPVRQHFYIETGPCVSHLSAPRLDRLGYGLNQWETMLQCKVVAHWLSPYTEWSLLTWISITSYTIALMKLHCIFI